MSDFNILHVEDDVECNFLLTEALRKEKRASVSWAPNKTYAERKMRFKHYDLIVCGGDIPDWPGHVEDVLRLSGRAEVIVYASRQSPAFSMKTIIKAFSKSSEGTHTLIKYIKSKIRPGMMNEEDS